MIFFCIPCLDCGSRAYSHYYRAVRTPASCKKSFGSCFVIPSLAQPDVFSSNHSCEAYRHFDEPGGSLTCTAVCSGRIRTRVIGLARSPLLTCTIFYAGLLAVEGLITRGAACVLSFLWCVFFGRNVIVVVW